jgi:signal peptidase I
VKLHLPSLDGRLWREVLIVSAAVAVVYLGLSSTLRSAVVLGASMVPNLQDGERVFVNKLAYSFGELPRRGDIIVFKPPEELHSQYDYIKRVIGLPGERVEIRLGRVLIRKPDGKVVVLDESRYIAEPSLDRFVSDIVPEGHYFVMGDNRNVSAGSQNGWTVPIDSIVGRAWVVVWPPELWGRAPNYMLPAVAP